MRANKPATDKTTATVKLTADQTRLRASLESTVAHATASNDSALLAAATSSLEKFDAEVLATAKLTKADDDMTAAAPTCDDCGGELDDDGNCKACKGKSASALTAGKSAAPTTTALTAPEKEATTMKTAAELAADAAALAAANAPATTAQPSAPARSFASRVVELCSIAGLPNEAFDLVAAHESADHLHAASGKPMKTIDDVMAFLREKRIAAAGTGNSENQVQATFGTVSVDALDSITKTAKALAANSGGRLSQSQALEQAMKANPQAYQSFDEERHMAMLTPGSTRRYMSMLGPRLKALGLSSVGAA